MRRLPLLAIIVLLAACGAPGAQVPAPQAPAAQGAEAAGTAGIGGTMNLNSPAFSAGETIPKKYTCDGENVSPPLAWSGTPDGTLAFALLADDPDAPGGTWVHWVLFNLPADTTSLPEGLAPDKKLQNGALHGTNSFRKPGYGGPCPPSGTHRYYFKLYALDGPLSLGNNALAKDVEQAMQGHILAEAQLMGRYKR